MRKSITVPTLAEADSTYAAMTAKLAELNAETATTRREIDAIAADILARPAPAVRAEVAALLGQSVDTTLTGRPARLAALRQHAADLEAAAAIIQRQLAERRGPASKAACEAVRGEYARRVAGIVTALDAVRAATQHADDLLNDLEREDVSLAYLPAVRPFFLGDRKDGHIERYLKEVREAGYGA